ncbi:pyruvate,water dikinase [Kribbella sp. VKM Ac-2571]|uniref:PEP/pyruvate-binding domain-containing protein n=1 Tax=Kribbella sp. VKM Ac-2571 TaxID=2512222 RepID=UPI001060C51E|nr:PEP/pyruvate-binding domain-containing protein [Kribbella sp. VKM Ac-2571]TDO45150.1 pyruvate,water dikinase [Kribbella sp. VKM Ac-2571]
MLVPLVDATIDRCGAKAATLATLLRNDLPVPEGIVIPFDAQQAGDGRPDKLIDGLPDGLVGEISRWLASVGDPPVAVRSSAANEDTALASAAGQHDSFLGVQGIDAIVDAVRACWASVWSPRATAYRNGSDAPAMAVIIQRHLDADVSGVMFTNANGPTLIEASWGLGPSVVEGRVTPDRYQVTADGKVTRTIANKLTSLDRHGSALTVRQVPTAQRRTPTLSDATAVQLAALAQTVTTLLGSPQDIEWSLITHAPWLLQSRPITTRPPAAPALLAGDQHLVVGVAGSHGTATGPARVVRGPADFPTVRPGDILICPYTDPAWTPLLSIAAGVVTEIGGILSHAAIVAREQGIPAVLAVPQATTQIPNGTTVTINGTVGTVHL